MEKVSALCRLSCLSSCHEVFSPPPGLKCQVAHLLCWFCLTKYGPLVGLLLIEVCTGVTGFHSDGSTSHPVLLLRPIALLSCVQ